MARLIQPRVARAVARRLAGDEAMRDSYLMERLHRDLAETVPQSERLVAEASGISPPPPVRWGVIDRAAWADANFAGMNSLLSPLADKLGARLDSLPPAARVMQQGLVSVEVGALLGYVSRRVLGQYDLLVPETEGPPARGRGAPPNGGAALYFVGPNIVETERRFNFVPREFALWISVHEVTHRFQFAGVPWLRERFFSLVHSYLSSTDLDARTLAGRLRTAGKRLLTGAVPAEERNPVYLLASPEQKETLEDIQALMSVVEGHGNYVMDSVGADVIPSFSRMRSVFDGRRAHVGRAQRAVNSVIGLDMKMRQYETGQRFCEAVVEASGRTALDKLWRGPESFPSLAELRSPDRWLHRVA